ncbi:hypothetical protein B0H14DRAFT_2555584 [Mycena olivaceomarginata]|nr:hypothetical protein B0H14DRAFT_2555584 [Mycena olivaceomarginata]
MNWHTNDRAIVSFLTLKASRSEQEFIAPYAAAGTRAVWDALVTRHFDATLQIRLLREAFSVRYGAEPPAVTSARIDALATRILALGPINKTTLVSAAMVNAVQARGGAHLPLDIPQRNDLENSAEQAAISAVATERSTLLHVLFASGFEFSPVLGRLDAISIAPGWDQAISAKQNATAEVQKLLTSLESWVPATYDCRWWNPDRLLVLQEPDDTERKSLIGLLVQSLMRLDKTAMQAHWERKIERRRAVEEVLRLLTTLEWLPASESGAGPSHNYQSGGTRRDRAHRQTDERELKDLTRSLFDAVQRLDSTRINLDWEHARNARRNAVRAVEALQSQLDALPSCTEEQDTLKKIEAHRSHVQFLYFPAVSAYLGNPNEKERLRLSELLFQALERLDGIMLQPGWKKARAQAKGGRERGATTTRQPGTEIPSQIYCRLRSHGSSQRAEGSEGPRKRAIENNAVILAVQFYLEKPNEKERARLSDLLVQATERLDRLPVESGWEICTQEKHKAYSELQELQDKIV